MSAESHANAEFVSLQRNGIGHDAEQANEGYGNGTRHRFRIPGESDGEWREARSKDGFRVSLFIPQGDDGIDAGGAASGNHSSKRGDEQNQNADEGEGERIRGSNLKEKGLKGP
jgi:hypothetical protein